MRGLELVVAMRTKQSKCGFTLVEMMTVSVLIALLAAGAGGLYVGTYKKRLVEKSARQMLMAAKYARVFAVERKVACKMVFDKAENRFQLCVEMDDETTGQVQVVILSDKYSKPVKLPEGVVFEDINIQSRTADARAGADGRSDYEERASDDGQSSEIVFATDGTADNAVITIGDGKRDYTMVVSAGLGRAKIQKGKWQASEAISAAGDSIDLDEQ